MGSRFRVINLPNNEGNVLVFGFLLTWTSHDTNAYVTPIASHLKESWFAEAFSVANVKLIVCVCHIDTPNAEVTGVMNHMKKGKPNTPITLLTGHGHVKRTSVPGEDAFAMETGRYLESVGIVSFDLNTSAIGLPATPATATLPSLTSEHVGLIDNANFLLNLKQSFVDASIPALQKEAGISATNWPTPIGNEIRVTIQSKFRELGLDRPVGCSNATYSTATSDLPGSPSLYRLMIDSVLPHRFDPIKQTNKFLHTLKNNVMRSL